MTENYAQDSATSQGHALSGQNHLDAHFALAQPEYEALLKAVGLQSGWHVLDAGCGVGSFLPLMSELVGENSRITAVDLAPENLDIVETKIAPSLACSLETKMANITELPFADDTFDALWCANVCQYLTDEELRTALTECRRVVRPGGLVAIKEFDMAMWYCWPPGPRLIWRLYEALAQARHTYFEQAMRSSELMIWLKQANLQNGRFQSVTIDRSAPLKPYELSFVQEICQIFSHLASMAELSEEDRALWQQISNVEAEDHITNGTDFLYREGALLFVGQVPSD